MSLSSLSSVASGNTPYDFTQMTSKQAISAGGDLARRYLISGDQFAILAGETTALTSVPIGGNQAGGLNSLASTAEANYLDVLKNSIASMKSMSGKNQAEMNGLNTSESLQVVLTDYQYGASNGIQQSGTALSTLA